MPLLINKVPKVRGKLVSNADISSTSWFKVGGPIELLFIPKDLIDLTEFIENLSIVGIYIKKLLHTRDFELESKWH